MEEHLDSHQNAEVSEPETMYVGNGEDGQVQVAADQTEDGAITWEASEFAHYEKNNGWFMLYLMGGVGLTVIMYFVVDLMSAIVVLLLTVSMLVYGKMKPKSMRYTVSDFGISVGNSNHAYSEFKSFSFMSENGVNSIYLTPLKRFMVPLTIYVAPENQDQIAEMLSEHLPAEPYEPDFMDKVIGKLRF